MIYIADNWSIDVIEEHSAYLSKRIDDALEGGGWAASFSAQFIRSHRASIIYGRPCSLRVVIQSAEVLRDVFSPADYANFEADCARVFNYEAFSRRGFPKWGGYALCDRSKYKMCPYCHQAFAHTLVPDGTGSFRPTLDHYYAKSRYPYLALSIFNLVPSCYTCNSQLKLTKDFYAERHVHPFERTVDEVEFAFDIDDYLLARRTGNPVPAVKVRGCGDAAIRSVSTFVLDKRFAINASYLDSFAARVFDYVDGERSRSGIVPGIGFALTQEDVIGFSSEGYKDEMLGKIKLDIYSLIRTR